MTADELANKQAEFQKALLSRLARARSFNRLVVDPMIEKVGKYGGVEVAKDELKNIFLINLEYRRTLRSSTWMTALRRAIRFCGRARLFKG